MELIKNNVQIPERNACLDYARIMAVLLVIYGHLYDPNPDNFVRVFIYQFHMPFFFFVSGMLHKYNGTIQFKKYAKTLLIPVFFFSTVCFLYKGIFYHWGFEYKSNVYINGENLFGTYANYWIMSFQRIIHGIELPCGPAWFLVALFYCKCFHDFLCKYFKLGIVVWCVLFLCLCYNRHRELFFANAIVSMPFYSVGYWSKSKVWLSRLKDDYKMCALLIVFMFVLVFFAAKFNGMISSYSILFSTQQPRWLGIPFYYISGFAGSIMLLSVASLFNKSTKLSVFLGNGLISFLGFQTLFYFTLAKTVGINQGYFISIWIALAIFVACIPLHWVVMRCAPCLLGKSNNK